jgi:A118 family predicted phage portal protein
MRIKQWLLNRNFFSKEPLLPITDEVKQYFTQDLLLWKDIYQGGGDWRYTRKGGLSGGLRKVGCLNIAQALCSELSNLCISQQMDFHCNNQQAQAYLEHVLQTSGFWKTLPHFVEQIMAQGAGVIKTFVREGQVCLDFVPCDAFIPLQYGSEGVYGGAFLQTVTKNKQDYLLIEQHEKTQNGYRITNRLYQIYEGGRVSEVPLDTIYPDLVSEVEIEGLGKPLFSYIRACGGGLNSPLGVSVFSKCIDSLKSLDIIFDSLEREFVLGKKRIIVPTSAIRGEYDQNGRLKHYFDTSDEVYQALSPNDNEELKIIDNSTQLRVTEHLEALEGLLDLLCLQVGLSPGTLSYHNGTPKTATEVISHENKTHRTKTAHQQLLREGLIEMAESVLLLGQVLGEIQEGGAVTVTFSDSVARDNSSKIENAIKLFQAGLLDKNQALAEIYGLSDAEAARIRKEVNG